MVVVRSAQALGVSGAKRPRFFSVVLRFLSVKSNVAHRTNRGVSSRHITLSACARHATAVKGVDGRAKAGHDDEKHFSGATHYPPR